jgi:hypothetical protein
MQFGDKTASDETNSHFRHVCAPSVRPLHQIRPMDSRRRIVALTPSAALYHAAEREKRFWCFSARAMIRA